MCDKEAKINFRWSHVAEGVIIIILLAVLTQFWIMRDFVQWSEQFHEEIPDDFFNGERWSYSDELRDQQTVQHQFDIMATRMSLIETQNQHIMLSLDRIETAVMDK